MAEVYKEGHKSMTTWVILALVVAVALVIIIALAR